MDSPLPPVGLGTMGIEDPTVVETAIELGYRHLDTAQIYENEAVVGEAIAESDVPREALLVATKLWVTDLAADDVGPSVQESLDRLGLEYVDLLYVHRPRGAYDPAGTLPALDALVEEGLVRGIGLSNFSVEALETAREHLESPVAAHQVEHHPLFWREELVADAREHGHPLVAYAPLASGKAFDLPAVREAAEAHGVSPAGICLAWALAREGVVVVPKASSETHLRANLEATDLRLSDAEVDRIDAIEREEELFPD
jgi:2,5-diketo-D-gluconate reductase B